MWRILIPNSLTAYRLCIGIALPALYLNDWRIGLLVYGVTAAVSDLEGRIARRLKGETEFGRKFDPVADLVLCFGGVSVVLIDAGLTWYALLYWAPVLWTTYYSFVVSIMRWDRLVDGPNEAARRAIALMMVSGCTFMARIALEGTHASLALEVVALATMYAGCFFEYRSLQLYLDEADQAT